MISDLPYLSYPPYLCTLDALCLAINSSMLEVRSSIVSEENNQPLWDLTTT